MYDVVIVGGRCAGAPLAMLLARAGHKVVIVDRASFPSDTMSTHFIQSPGMQRLRRWGLLDTVLATNVPPVTKALFDPGDILEFDVPLVPGIPGLISPRRYILDKILVDAAVEAGADLAEGVTVNSLIRQDGRVVGVAGHSSEGSFEARGRFTVGADGRHSKVAAEVDADLIRYVDPLDSGYYSYYADTGIPSNRTQLFYRDDITAVTFPTNDGLLVVAILWRLERFADLKRDIEGNFNAALRALGPLGEKVLDGERAERFTGAADLANFYRKCHGPGWALVGDACYHKDPVPADGISDAFRGAEMLATALDRALTDESSESDAFVDYERGYTVAVDDHFDHVIRATTFESTPQERLEAFIAIRMLDAQESEALAGLEPAPGA